MHVKEHKEKHKKKVFKTPALIQFLLIQILFLLQVKFLTIQIQIQTLLLLLNILLMVLFRVLIINHHRDINKY